MDSINIRAAGAEVQSDRSPVDTAWLVLEAANDLGDQATVEVCRRVLDASLRGVPPAQAALPHVVDYFR